MATVFVDESKRDGYTMAAVQLDDTELAAARRTLRSLIPKGQRRIHFTNDSPATRRRMLATMCSLPLRTLIVQCPRGLREAQARAKCLAHIIEWMPTGSRLVLEVDRGIVDADRRLLNRLTEESGFDFRHLAPTEDPGLWLPDATAWCWTRGGAWRAAIAPIVADIITVK